MAFNLSQAQYNTAIQTQRELYVKVNVLNKSYSVVGSIEGNVISGNVQITSESSLRRSCTMSFVVTDDSLGVAEGGIIWLDKMIQIYAGVKENFTEEIVWNNLGMYIIDQPTYDYDAENNTLSFSGLDLMANLSGVRNGYIAGIGEEDMTLIPMGSNVRSAIIAVLEENGFSRYVVSECVNLDGSLVDVPYDMEFSQGSTWLEVLEKLNEVLPIYQIYFDTDGVFHYEQLPLDPTEAVILTPEIWNNNVIRETDSIDFEAVKNVVEVYGSVHDPDYYAPPESITIDQGNIEMTISGVVSVEDYLKIGFTLPQEIAEQEINININSLGSYPLVNINREAITSLEADTYWVMIFDIDHWEFLGHLQARAEWSDFNPESPFYINGAIGEIRLPLYGGEFNDIYSDELALQRAKYEIYKRSRLNDTISLETIPIYWADVNMRCEYKPLGSEQPNLYTVKSISIGLGNEGTETWELNRFYENYPML